MILKNLEKKIWDFEGFQVRFVYSRDGRDVRDDKRNVGNYSYERQARNSLTVKEFQKRRLKKFKKYGWKGEILLGTGSVAHGNMTLSKVRDSYN